jgi:hypothetical protein
MKKRERLKTKDPKIPYTILKKPLPHAKPRKYKLKGGEKKDINCWVDLYRKLCLDLYRIDKKKMRTFLENPMFMTKNKSRNYFDTTDKYLIKPYQIAYKLYIETHFGKEKIREMIINMLYEYEMDPEDLLIYKSPYTIY